MKTATASIDIAAPPALVRERFMAFKDLPKYHHNGFFKKIEPLDPNKPIQPGDKFRNSMEIGTFEAVIKENSPTCFTWAGGNSMVFLGEHSFRFEPSKTIPGGTTFTQHEVFTGPFSFIMGDNMAGRLAGIHKKSTEGWVKYNQDLKRWCEQS